MNKEINTCKECKSDYFLKTSKRENLCPNCAHYLYGQKQCGHRFEKSERCTKCYWDGTFSERISALIERNKKKLKKANISIMIAIVVFLIGAILTVIGVPSADASILSLTKYSFSQNIILIIGIFGVLVSIPFYINSKNHKKRLREEIPYLD